jgi:hypothetical protein
MGWKRVRLAVAARNRHARSNGVDLNRYRVVLAPDGIACGSG